MEIRHYWFYPIAYVYGTSLNAVKLDKKPFSIYSKVYSVYVGDTSFCDVGTFLRVGDIQGVAL